MAKTDRNNPARSQGSDSRMSLVEFMREFPDDATCLKYLWRQRFSPDGTHAHCPKCDTERVFKKYPIKNRRTAWSCTQKGCGHHIHPLAGTIFEKSSTSLHLWFYAMYLMSSTRCGISAKQLEREIGVGYKTAWRMFHLIRNQLMAQGTTEPLSGVVETDETFVGGKPRKKDRATMTRADSRAWASPKVTVWGAVERDGQVRAQIIPFSGAGDIRPRVLDNVKADATLYSDGFNVYRTMGYNHAWVDHHREEYVRGAVHTQTIEGFWSIMKGGLNGVYRGAVSKQHLQSYVDEYAFHYNHRTGLAGPDPFRVLLERAIEQ
jgi:transposase-like protein